MLCSSPGLSGLCAGNANLSHALGASDPPLPQSDSHPSVPVRGLAGMLQPSQQSVRCCALRLSLRRCWYQSSVWLSLDGACTALSHYWLRLGVCLPTGSGGWTPLLPLLVCTAFVFLIKLSVSWPVSLLVFLLFSLCPRGEDRKPGAEKVFGCSPGSTHHRKAFLNQEEELESLHHTTAP